MNETPAVTQRSIRLSSPGIRPRDPAEAPVHDRTQRMPGYHALTIARLRILLCGAGGLGGEIGHSLVRSGFGYVGICDHDSVELSNLNRQRFYAEDLYRNKAIQLARNLHREAVLPITIEGWAMDVQHAIAAGYVQDIHAAICGVDNDQTRVFMARWGLERRIPVIFTAVNRTADYGYVFVQTSRPGDPCFGCLFPDAASSIEPAPCDAAASIDILKTVAGPVIFVLGALFLPDRPCRWRYKEIDLTGATPDGVRNIECRPDCPICLPASLSGRRTARSIRGSEVL